MAMFVTACGDDLPAPPAPPTECAIEAPAVIATWPSDEGRDVPTDGAVVATFASPMDGSTITADSFRVDGTVGRLIVDGRTVTLVPDGPLSAGGQHTATITSEIRDESGAALPADVTWTFETRPGARRWRESQFGRGSGRVAHGVAGELLAVWSDYDIQEETLPSSVFAASYRAEAGWSAAERLGAGTNPRVTIDDDGAAWVLWSSIEGLRGRRRTSCTGWEEEVGLGQIVCTAMAVDRQRGTHGAVCRGGQGEGQADHVVKIFSSTGGWSDTTLGGGAHDGVMAFDRDGRAHVLLRNVEGAPCSAELVVMRADGSVEDHRDVRDDASCIGTSPPAIGFDAAGYGIAAVSGSPFTVLEFDPSTGWADDAVTLDDAADLVAVSPRGRDVVWTRPGADTEIWAARWTDDGWTEPAQLHDSPDRITALFVAAAPSGDAVVIATRDNQPLLFARRTHGADWDAMDLLPVEALRPLSLSMSPGGDVAVSGGRINGGAIGDAALATVVRFE